jgi:hypothetical protein
MLFLAEGLPVRALPDEMESLRIASLPRSSGENFSDSWSWSSFVLTRIAIGDLG